MSTPLVANPAKEGWHRGLFLVILAGLGMVGPFSIDTMFPAFAQLSAEWGVSEFALQQIISVYMLTFAVMSLVHGPLSDALGRKPVIIVGTIVFIAASVGSAMSTSLSALLVFRAIQGLSAGAGVIISRAMVRDVFSDAQAQRTMSHIAMIFGLAPAVAPVVGGLLLGLGSWRLIFWFLVAVGVVMLALVVFFLPETHPAPLRTAFRPGPLVGGLVSVIRHPGGRRLAFTAQLNMGAMFLYISSAALVIGTLLNLGETDYWILFVPMISGMVLGSWASSRLAGRISPVRQANIGYLISLGAGGVNLGLSLIPATTALPWPIVSLPVLTFGLGLTFPVVTLAMLDLFASARGAASSVQNFVTLLGNAAIAGIGAPLLARSFTGLAVGSLTMMSLSALLWRRHITQVRISERNPNEAAGFEPLD